jgi:hypothetical protein
MARLYEASTELVNLDSFFQALEDILYKRDPSRSFSHISWAAAPQGIAVNFTDSLYPDTTFSKTLKRENVVGLQVRGDNARNFAEELLNHDGKQSERDAANLERRFIAKTKEHPTGEVLLRILDELKKLNTNRGE